MLVYGADCGYSERLYLLYDGIHYDALTQCAGEQHWSSSVVGNELTVLAKRFPTAAHSSSAEAIVIEDKVKAFARACQAAGKFTSMGTCSLQCLVCYAPLEGQTAARQHATETGHQNFGQLEKG
jgi:ubiquitin thioesterase OTU1